MNSPLLSPEDVADLAMTLRDAGYNVGPDQCIAAQRLMVTLAAQGEQFSDRRRQQSWLAPIFCGSPTEQADFAGHYADWLTRRGEPPPDSLRPSPATGKAQPPVRGAGEISRLRRALVIVLTAAAVGGATYGIYQIQHELTARTLRVQVVDENNEPLSGASLTFRNSQVKPDQDGGFSLQFRLLDLPAIAVAEKDGNRDSHTLDSHNYENPVTLHLRPRLPPPTPQPEPAANPTRLDLTAGETAFLSQTRYVKPPCCEDPWAKLTFWQRIYYRHYRDLFIAAASFPLLLACLWILWMHLPRLQLIRWKSQKEIRLDALRVKGSRAEFFASPGFRRIAQQLRRHRLVQSSDLDADRTVVASAARGGWFTPIYLWRKRLPDYLILIDRAGFRDFYCRLIDDFVKNLRLGRVEIDCYDFYSDPRACYGSAPPASGRSSLLRADVSLVAPVGKDSSPSTVVSVLAAAPYNGGSTPRPRFSLDDLLAKHPNHNVFIFSDAAGFFGPLDGKLQPWVEQFLHWKFRALLVPERLVLRGDARTRILQDAGFWILSATEKGLSTAVEVLDGGDAQRADFVPAERLDSSPEYPGLLLGDDLRWLSDLPPHPAQLKLLIGQLRAYLGQHTFTWLAACAVYPELLWDLTIYLGNELNALGPDEERLTLLLRLPWFRHGSLPDWFRECLVNAMPTADRDVVRLALWRLLGTALETPLDGFELRYARDGAQPHQDKLPKRWGRRLLSNFIHTEPPQSPLRDYVFLSVLHGRKPAKGLPVPNALRLLFGRFAQVRRPILQIAVGVLMAAAASAVIYHYRPPAMVTGGAQPLPPPTGPAPYHLNLNQILGGDVMSTIQAGATLVFHVAGDTGGVNNPAPQAAVAAAMISQFRNGNAKDNPAFLYLLGNLVYYDGAAQNYYDQFYRPYREYPSPIYAIPGNRDGAPPPGGVSLDAFVRNFCASRPVHTPEAGSVARSAMTQPNSYWTLDTPFATIVGLYTNVVFRGYVDDAQEAWLASELKNAPNDKALIIAMNQPVYSMINARTGSEYLGSVLDQAMLAAGRAPDLVLAAYANNYQRFSRTLGVDGRIVPYIVNGAGGYYNLAKLRAAGPLPQQIGPDVVLNKMNDSQHGFLRISVTRSTLKAEYFTVDESHAANATPRLFDGFAIALNPPAAVAKPSTAEATLSAVTQMLEGVYKSENLGPSNAWHYLRFYRDGTVLEVSSIGTADQVSKWFHRPFSGNALGSGSYTAQKSILKFSTTSAIGTIDYTGKIAGDTLILDEHSSSNGFRGQRIYRLVRLAGSTAGGTTQPAGQLPPATQQPATQTPPTTRLPPTNAAVSEISGVVRTADGKPVARVEVIIQGAQTPVVTDVTGQFKIAIPSAAMPGGSMFNGTIEFIMFGWDIISPRNGTIPFPTSAAEPVVLTVRSSFLTNQNEQQRQQQQQQQVSQPNQEETLPSTGSERMIFDNWNKDGVMNGPPNPTRFTITQPYYITHIYDYHWNDGRGANPAHQSIGLRGRNYLSWPVSASSGQGGAPNVNWDCTPKTTIPAGEYEVVDSDRASWSHNRQSGSAGFSRIQGYPVSNAPGSASPTANSPSAALTVPPAEATSATVVSALGGGFEVTLSWNVPQRKPTRNPVLSYNIYRSTSPGGPYQKIGSVAGPPYRDENVISGMTYFYVTTSVNMAGESNYSSELKAVIPEKVIPRK